MSPWAWAAVASVAAGTLGWKLGRVSTLLEIGRLREINAALKAAQDHSPCLEIIGRQWEELDRLEHELAVERGSAMVAEVEQYLAEEPEP